MTIEKVCVNIYIQKQPGYLKIKKGDGKMARKKTEFKFESSERITPPNHELISKLIKKAMGDRTATVFAKLCNISLPTMSKYINCQTKSAMTDEFIFSIAENADPDSGVTLALLQEANGLLVKSNDKERTPDAPSFGMVFEKTAKEVVLSKLAVEGFSVKAKNDCSQTSEMFIPDFEIETDALAEYGIDSWQFDVYFTNNGPLNIKKIEDKLSRIFAAAYLRPEEFKNKKTTLITDSIATFNYVREHYENVRIQNLISVVLIEVASRKAIDEFQIPTLDDRCEKIILTFYKNY